MMDAQVCLLGSRYQSPTWFCRHGYRVLERNKVMNTQSVRSSTGLRIVGSLDADYAELARAGRALQGRAIREAIVGVFRWFGAGPQARLIGGRLSRHA